MNRLIWALLIFSLGVLAYPQTETSPTAFDISKIDFSKISDEDMVKTEAHRDALRAEAKTKLEEQAAVVSDQSKTLADIQLANDRTKKAFDNYRDAAETQIEKGNQAIAALNHVLKKLHLAKWILVGVWLGFCALVALKIPGIGMYVGGGLAAAGIAFIWFWI